MMPVVLMLVVMVVIRLLVGITRRRKRGAAVGTVVWARGGSSHVASVGRGRAVVMLRGPPVVLMLVVVVVIHLLLMMGMPLRRRGPLLEAARVLLLLLRIPGVLLLLLVVHHLVVLGRVHHHRGAMLLLRRLLLGLPETLTDMRRGHRAVGCAQVGATVGWVLGVEVVVVLGHESTVVHNSYGKPGLAHRIHTTAARTVIVHPQHQAVHNRHTAPNVRAHVAEHVVVVGQCQLPARFALLVKGPRVDAGNHLAGLTDDRNASLLKYAAAV